MKCALCTFLLPLPLLLFPSFSSNVSALVVLRPESPTMLELFSEFSSVPDYLVCDSIFFDVCSKILYFYLQICSVNICGYTSSSSIFRMFPHVFSILFPIVSHRIYFLINLLFVFEFVSSVRYFDCAKYF